MAQRIKPSAFARREGVSPQAVSQWIQDGRISLGADGLLDPVLAHQERIATESPLPKHQANKARFEAARLESLDKTTATMTDDADNDAEATTALSEAVVLGAKLKYETYRLQKAKAELANLEIDKAAGLLVDRGDVERLLVDVGTMLRTQLEAFPDQLTALVLGCGNNAAAIHQATADACHNVLLELSELMRRKASALPKIVEDEDFARNQ